MNIDASTNVMQASLAVPPATQPQPAQTNTQTQQTTKQPATVEPANDQVSISITVPQLTLDTIQNISSVSDLLNSTAKSIRETGSSLKASSDLLSQMKSELGKIIKNFPPFPPESAERREILMSYQSIREQIDKMSIPAPPAPVYERVQSIWQEVFPANKQSRLDTPALTQNATDSQVQQADEQLTFTRSAVTQLREAIGASLN
jgi:hypothetical protein